MTDETPNPDNYVRVYLSRRNLLALLRKLDNPESVRTIVKNDMEHPKYKQSHQHIAITAVEDEDYYIDRKPGVMVEDLLDGT
jgi:hypothetical protein